MSTTRMLALMAMSLLLALMQPPLLLLSPETRAPVQNLFQQAQESEPGLVTARVLAADGEVHSLGPAVTLPVQVINVQRLGAATVLVRYDPTIIKPTGWERSRTFDVTLCSTNYDSDADGTADSVKCDSLSLQGVTTGATPATLANIAWQAVAVVNADTDTVLQVQVETFTDDNANPLETTTQNGTVTVLSPEPPKLLFLPLVRG